MTILSLLFTVERHRKEKINAGINRIGNLLPCSQALKQVRNKLVSFRFLFYFACVRVCVYIYIYLLCVKLTCIHSSAE